MLPYYVHISAGRFGSAGMRALQILAKELQATIMGVPVPANAIAIYPEVTHGNPINAKHVVRWILFTPGILGGPKRFSSDDLLFTWDRRYLDLPADRVLQVSVIERDLFVKPEHSQRDIDCLWIGKGSIPKKSLDLPLNVLIITREWPETREALAGLLQRTRTLYSYDHHSALNCEAAMCGAKVVLLPEQIELSPSRLPPPAEYIAMLDNFIAVSQAYFAS